MVLEHTASRSGNTLMGTLPMLAAADQATPLYAGPT